MSASDAAKRRRRWRGLHRWLAYLFGALFVVQGASGALLVLADPIDDWLNPELTVPAGQRMALLTMAEALEAQHPGAIGLGVTRIDEAGRLTAAFWPTPDPLVPSQPQYWLARLHPRTGETVSVLRYGTWSFDRRDLIGLFYALHTNLTLGALGKGLQILVAAGGLLLVGAGVAVWRGRRAMPSAIDRPVRRWHRRIGIVAALALSLLLASGLTLQFETVLDPGFGYRSQKIDGQPPIGMRAAWQAAALRFGDVDTRMIMAPFIDGGVYRIDLIPRAGELAGQTVEVFVDAWSAAVIRVRHDRDREGIARLLGWLEALHGGRVLGLPGEVLAAIAGLAPALLLATGLRIRWRRR